MNDANVTLIHRSHQEGMVARHEAVIEEIYASDFVNDSPGLPDFLRHGAASIHEHYHFLWSAFSDISITEDEAITEDNLVGVRWVWEARHTGPFLGIAPTGAAVKIEGYDIAEISSGKIQRIWVCQDNMSLMGQLQSAVQSKDGPST